MGVVSDDGARVRHADRFFIGGEWVEPSSDAVIEVSDSATEEIFLRVAEAIGREGGTEGLHPFLETKTVILDGPPAGYGA
jgi:acyl-CoA reductase-like NAD-dependent aldehyde dehydrogenase